MSHRIEIVWRNLAPDAVPPYCSNVTRSNEAGGGSLPPMFSHWAVLLKPHQSSAHSSTGPHFFALGLDHHRNVLEQTRWTVNPQQQPSIIGYTDMDFDAFSNFAANLLGHLRPQYNLMVNNCKHFALSLYFATSQQFGPHANFHAMLVRMMHQGLVSCPEVNLAHPGNGIHGAVGAVAHGHPSVPSTSVYTIQHPGGLVVRKLMVHNGHVYPAPQYYRQMERKWAPMARP